MKSLSRRGFLATSAGAAIALRSKRADAQERLLRASPFAPNAAPALKTLAAAALESAKRAGATYADVRFRVSEHEEWGFFQPGNTPIPYPSYVIGVGVRALMRGYWGVASQDGIPNADTMAKLGRDAAGQAEINAKGPARTVDLAPAPVVTDGQWTMPVETDPFTVSYDEKLDFMIGISRYVQRQGFGIDPISTMSFIKETRTFASSEGAFSSQTVFSSGGFYALQTDPDWETEWGGNSRCDFFSSAGAGWEYVSKTPFQDNILAVIDDAMRKRRTKPVEIGRYDVVFDACAMANILDVTIGAATEVDRAMGYLASESGTSFLDDPLAMLGTYQMGSPLINVSATRSLPGGGATVKWDDEGVEPADTPLVTKGMLTDFQTTRESASWLAPYYQQQGRRVRSSGGYGASEATRVGRVWPANFVFASDAATDTSFDDLIAKVKKGYVIKGGAPVIDFQCLNGGMSGNSVYEIVDGKLGSAVSGAQVIFRAPEFWKSVAAIGGRGSAASFGSDSSRVTVRKSEFKPRTQINYNVQAVPALVTQLAMTDMRRKS